MIGFYVSSAKIRKKTIIFENFTIFAEKYPIMAVLTMFYGIIISMYYFDNRQHHFPHIHVKCQGMEAVIRIPDGEIIEGELPQGKNKLVQAWLEIHKDELMADWELASNGTNIFQIEPLK